MNEKVKAQFLAVRETGLTNLFDLNAVQRIAYDMDFFELVNFIEESKSVPRFIHVAAIDSPGLTCSAAIAEYVTDILKAVGLSLKEKVDWNGTRENVHAFRQMSDEEKDAYIAAHPDYGKIVCRCETISEGEIRDACRRNPKARDIDGVKRRTRAGMGRCQGGFCSPYVMRIISEECGIPMENVTKKGSDSRPIIGKL